MPRLYDMSSNASAKATSEKSQKTLKNPSGSEFTACGQGLFDGTQETQKGLKGYNVTDQELKFKTTRCLFMGVRSFHSSEEVW